MNCWLNEVFYCTEWQLLIELSIGVHTFALISSSLAQVASLRSVCAIIILISQYVKLSTNNNEDSSHHRRRVDCRLISTAFLLRMFSWYFARDKIKMKFLPLFFYVFSALIRAFFSSSLAVCVFRLAMEIEFQYESSQHAATHFWFNSRFTWMVQTQVNHST